MLEQSFDYDEIVEELEQVYIERDGIKKRAVTCLPAGLHRPLLELTECQRCRRDAHCVLSHWQTRFERHGTAGAAKRIRKKRGPGGKEGEGPEEAGHA